MKLNKLPLNVIGLNRVGLNQIGSPSHRANTSDRPYIDPEVLASLVAVCICDGKSNNDPDRAVIKNLVDPDNPFVISNAAYKLNSGYGLYEEDFTTWINSSLIDVVNRTNELFHVTNNTDTKRVALSYNLTPGSSDLKGYKIKVEIIKGTGGEYKYYNEEGKIKYFTLNESKIYTLPTSHNSILTTNEFNAFLVNPNSSYRVTQIPSHQGAFVTDGKDDMITSTKTVKEMLGGSNEITVVSMIHQIGLIQAYGIALTNYIRNNGGYLRSAVNSVGKTGIYGYTANNLNQSIKDRVKVINTILGDKKDYMASISDSYVLDDSLFHVQNYTHDGIIAGDGSQLAWYWTIIANKVLTTDQINQVIAYFNLDRTLKPDILCNTIKQGITNENHAEFGDKLIDFSGNGRDIQLNNIAWKGDSGIGKYSADFESFDWAVNISQKQHNKATISLNGRLCNHTAIEVDEMKVNIIGNVTELIYWYIANPDDTTRSEIRLTSGINTLPKSYAKDDGQTYNIGFAYISGDSEITIEQIPSHAGALCLDGVSDFGKVTRMPVYKDYTVVTDREIFANIGAISSKNNPGAFVETAGNSVYSFGQATSGLNFISTRSISYLSKYSYCGQSITAGAAEDGTDMWLGTIRDNDTRFFNGAIYSLMSFPYSMSEFLIERQLKKHKLGTLYPDMVEFRPIVPKDDRIESINYYNENDRAYIGNYYSIGSNTSISFKMVKPYKITSIKVNGANTVYNHNNGFNFKMPSKSPQKFTNLNIEVDTSIVLFNPTINSNAIFEVGNEQNMTELIAKVRNHEIDGFIMYLSKLESKYILPNSWINKDTEVISYIYCLDNILQDDLHINIDGNSKYCLYADSSNNIAEFIIMDDNIFEEQYMTNVLTANTIDIQLDQYIRYEDIVQPYPSLFTLIDYDTEEVYSWGSKLKVGTKFKGKVINLLPNMYEWQGNVLYNGEILNWTVNPGIVAKEMAFSWNMPFKYLIDNNEPKVILSPRLLRIPNSSYKLLGYIPDISGHGNHGVIHNSAYAEGSGVNEDGSYQFDGVDDFVTIPTLSSGGKQVLMKVNWNTIDSIIYDQRGSGGFAIYCSDYNNPSDSITVPAYKGRNAAGTTYIDGIRNEYIIASQLRNVTHNIVEILDTSYAAGKTNPIIGKSHMNSNYGSLALYDFMLFDNISTDDKIKQLNEYVGIEAKVELPPYYWDAYGKTNLDEDKNYIANLGTVKDVIETGYPYTFADADAWWGSDAHYTVIDDYTARLTPSYSGGSSELYFGYRGNIPLKVKITSTETYSLLYHASEDIRFNVIANEPLITELPYGTFEIIGLGNDSYITIELLPTETSTLYGLSNINFAYDKMSGYGGYAFAKFDNTAEWIYTNNSDTIEVVNRDGYSVVLRKVGNGANYWHFRNTVIKSLGQDIRIGIYANNSVQIVWQLKYKLEGDTDYNSLAIASPTIEGNINTYVTLPYKTEQEIADLNAVDTYYSIYFIPIDLDINEEYTIEMLPLYPNGLVYDGITDYSENVNIPVFTDFTAIMKRKWLKNQGCPLIKGSKVYEGGNGNALLFEWDKAYNFVFYKRTDIMEGEVPENISFITPTNYNGNVITRGSEQDTNGICIAGDGNAGFANMVFYKLILYPKTIPLLQINFLKNLMERDEIIDLNNPIFVQE